MLRIAIASLLAATLSVPALAQDLPRRKSGLWEITMASPGGRGGKEGAMSMTQCVDRSRDDAFQQMGQQIERESKCTRTNIQRSPGVILLESTCDFGSMKTKSNTVLTGDVDSAYKMEIHSKYDPPMMGKAERTTVMEAKWLGACKAGQRPGDMTMPGGMTMNVYDMLDAKKK